MRARPPDLIRKNPLMDLPVSSSSSSSRIVESFNHVISSSLCNNHLNKKLMSNEINRCESIMLTIYWIELDKVDNQSNQSLSSSLYLSNIPQEKIYSLPIHKGKTNNNQLTLNQLKRRQHHLLSLLMNAVNRFHSFELYIYESIKRIDLDYSITEIQCKYSTTTKSLSPPLLSDVDQKFIGLIKSVTAWLANASQLLHLIYCDIDFNATFKLSVDELCQWSPDTFDHDDNNAVKLSNTATTSWDQLKEQLAEIVQTAFIYLADLCVLRLDLIAIPQLLLYLTKSVQILSNHHHENCATDSNTSNDSPDCCFPD
ncbi:unnamed protein product [Schistosoma mattheei]|uniref:Dilute domain-containing protein n=1 Tax=Schistosoma mattheei TaxID=31246 RepID=A0A183PAI7_9TREM|nr:unnamed protein product [Schistosoma mattheei]VDP57944.1 unnamed protein product [Schistosoma mattheei]